MNRLAAILPAANVLIEVDATSKKRAFEHAGVLFENQHSIARATVSDNLFARERLGSTGLGGGVAIPHCKTRDLADVLLAVGVSRRGIDFGAADGVPVTLIFLVVSPSDAPGLHLQALARISRVIRMPGVAEDLRRAATAAEIAAVLKTAEGRLPVPA